MDKQSCLVVGEAPESDDENIVISLVGGKTALQGTVIPGEASESDENDSDIDEIHIEEATRRSVSNEILFGDREVRRPRIKYDTLLHRKLCEKNEELQKGLNDLLKKPLANLTTQLNLTNQQLLASQVQIQDSVGSLKRIANNLIKIDKTLGLILSMPYIPKIQTPNLQQPAL